jgi:hypothetical protein
MGNIMKLAKSLAVVLALLVSVVSVGRAAESKQFPNLKCTVTPPGPSFTWLDHSSIPQATCFMANGDKAKLVLLTFDNPAGEQIDERFVRGFDGGLTSDGSIAKVNGQIITFCGVPCYEVHARLVSDSSLIYIRVFCANGLVYQLQLMGTAVKSLDKTQVERMFASFEFIGTPEPPTPKAGSVDRNSISYKMGRLAGTFMLVALALALVGRIVKKKA